MACTETATYVVTELDETWNVEGGSSSTEYKMFDILFAKNGVETTKQGVYKDYFDNYGIESETSGDGTDKNILSWWGVPTSGMGSPSRASESVTADRGGICVEESTATETESEESGTGGTVASDLGVSTISFASLADDVEFNGDTGLIRNGKFDLKWNNIESSAAWDDDTKGRYNSIEEGDVSGSIAIIKENVYDNTTAAAFNTFYDLNTGQNQTSPTITLVGGTGGKEFTVEYGSIEETAIEEKFKRYDSDWNSDVEGMIDELVQKAIDGSYQTRAGLNFKKTRVKDFKEKNITVFVNETMEGTTEELTSEQTMGTDVTAGTSDTTTTTTTMTTTMTTSNGGSTQGGY